VQPLKPTRYGIDPDTQKIARVYDLEKKEWARELAAKGLSKGYSTQQVSMPEEESGQTDIEQLRNEWDSQWEAESVPEVRIESKEELTADASTESMPKRPMTRRPGKYYPGFFSYLENTE